MDWDARWRQGQTGWHRDDVHDGLRAHAGDWKRVLVPLCGATRDIDWLVARGAEVVGIELSPTAVERLFAEGAARFGTPAIDTPALPSGATCTRYRGAGVTVYCGDVFEVGAAIDGTFDAVWDRAALVALPPSRRADYVAAIRAIAPGAALLISTYTYDPPDDDGPPFAVPESFVVANFADVELVARDVVTRERGGASAVWTSRLHAGRVGSPS